MTQTATPATKAPPRPGVSDDMIRAAVRKIIQELDASEAEIDDVVSAFKAGNHDGYDLAKALDGFHGWAMNADMVDTLDGLSMLVRQEHDKACRAWVKAYGIEPSLANGTAITAGVIAGVCEHYPATYMVKRPGAPVGQYALIKFEDAIPA